MTESGWEKVKRFATRSAVKALMALQLTTPALADFIHYSGNLVDLKGNPIDDAEVTLIENDELKDQTSTDQNGWFGVNGSPLAVSVADATSVAQGIAMTHNWPNAASNYTQWEAQTLGPGSMTVFNAKGQEVISQEISSIGSHYFTWGGLDKLGNQVAAGVYLYRLESDGVSVTGKIAYLSKGTTGGLNISTGTYGTMSNSDLIINPKKEINEQESGSLGRGVMGEEHSGSQNLSYTDIREISPDTLIFTKENIETKYFVFNRATQDTVLGIITANVGPEVLSELESQTIVEGDTATWNLNNHIYNDDGHFEVEAPYVIEQDSLLRLYNVLEGVYNAVLTAVDSDTYLNLEIPVSATVEVSNHAPSVSLEDQVLSSDEGTPDMQIGTATVIDEDTGDEHELEVVEQTHTDSATVYLDGDAIRLQKHPDFFGVVSFGVKATDDGGLEGTAYMNHNINPIADIEIIPRLTNADGLPIMNDVETTYQLGDSVWTAVGPIRVQMPAGTYQMWVENNSTGIFHPTAGRIDTYLSVWEAGTQVIVNLPLARRGPFDTENPEIEIGTEDMTLDAFKVQLAYVDRNTYRQVINSRVPSGIDLPNILNPNVHVDTLWSPNYGTPADTTLFLTQYVINTLIPQITGQDNYLPQWQGFVQPPEADPNGETFFSILYDVTETIGAHGEGVNNSNNQIYYGHARLPPNTTTIVTILGEIAGSQLGFRNDPDGNTLGGYISDWNDLNADQEIQLNELELNQHAQNLWNIITRYGHGFDF